MKKNLLCIALIMAMPCSGTRRQEAHGGTVEIMKRVADWQLAHINTEPQEHYDLSWGNGILYQGITDFATLYAEATGDSTYFDYILQVGRQNQWQPGQRLYHGDDVTVCQTWLALYERFKDRDMLLPTLARCEWIAENPSNTPLIEADGRVGSTDRWSWCDALIMAPPVYAHLYAITGKRKFLHFMDDEYRATYDALYDKSEHLFYRDANFIGKKDKDGNKIFWSRGNGWVLAGLVQILRNLPKDATEANRYRNLFVEMSYRIKDLQQPDGTWHTSLLSPKLYPSKETSGTGLFVYALTWGINAGLLPEKDFGHCVEKGWETLKSAVHTDGMLGYVQQIGASPEVVTYDMTEVYGVGAFLMTGCQIYLKDNKSY